MSGHIHTAVSHAILVWTSYQIQPELCITSINTFFYKVTVHSISKSFIIGFSSVRSHLMESVTTNFVDTQLINMALSIVIVFHATECYFHPGLKNKLKPSVLWSPTLY